MLESGPAAGALAAAQVAREAGLAAVVGFDMGGTTAKACLVERGEIGYGAEFSVGSQISTRRSWFSQLALKGLGPVPCKRQLTGEGLVQHNADRIPVGSLANSAAGRLLRRHVSRRSSQKDTVLDRSSSKVLHKTKVKDYYAPVRRHPNIRRFQIAVQPRGTVQGLDAASKLE